MIFKYVKPSNEEFPVKGHICNPLNFESLHIDSQYIKKYLL